MGMLLQNRLKEIQEITAQPAPATPIILTSEPEVASIYEAKSQFKASEFKGGDTYIWKKGDSLYDLANRSSTTVKDLMQFNEIESAQELEPGTPIHFPKPKPITPKIRIELLPEALPMHINRPDGARKWGFANMRRSDDAKGAGFYPHHTNLTILGIAHVPILDKDGNEAEAAYYLDGVSLGDYKSTNRIKYATGYIWSDMAEGHVERIRVVKEDVKPSAVEQQIQATVAEMDAALEAKKAAEAEAKRLAEIEAAKPVRVDYHGVDKAFVEEQLETTLKHGNAAFVETYQPLDAPVPCMAMIPEGVGEVDGKGMRFIWVHEFMGKRPDRKLQQHQEITIGGTFEYNGTLYGRPEASIKNFYWFGIPMDYLESQDQLFSVAAKLTFLERYMSEPLAKLVNNPRYRNYFRRMIANNKNKKG